MNKKSKIFIAIFFSIILITALIVGFINYSKEHKLNSKIEDSISTRVLSINNITSPINFNDLLKIETSKEYTAKNNNLKYDNDASKKDFTIKYANTSFYGSRCVKEYIFVDEKLKMCIFDIDTSSWQPKNIYEELVKINGEPDASKIKPNKKGADRYTWYGKNGTLSLSDDNISNSIEVIFEISN